jgi:unsaturated rhamnogalacturonyl hydrolase
MQTRYRGFPLFALCLVALWMPAPAPAQVLAEDAAEGGVAAEPAPAVSPELRLAQRVADWQLAHLEGLDHVRTFREQSADPRDWIQATFWIGLSELAEATGDRRYAQALVEHARREGYGFEPDPRHADVDAIGQAWLWAADRSGDPQALAPMRARFDAVLADPARGSLEFATRPGAGESDCQVRWCWSDALFMAPPAWVGLSRATGDQRYLDHADAEFQATTDYLYDPVEHLFFRDSRFFDQRGPAGRKVFWSRGNGWVVAGLVRVLQALPADHPRRPYYEALLKQMAARLATLQGEAGYWPSSLLDPQPQPETSGTAFFVYGLAWAVNAGLLSREQYLPVIERGWAALERAVQPDGRLGWVQQVGEAPAEVRPGDTQLFGVGALLMAATEVDRLRGSR